MRLCQIYLIEHNLDRDFEDSAHLFLHAIHLLEDKGLIDRGEQSWC